MEEEKITTRGSLPVDVESQILSKLPAKSVVRFRLVSKLWSSITTDPYFISSFQTRPRLLVFFKEHGNYYVFSIPQHNPSRRYDQSNHSYYSSSQPIDSYHTTFPKICCSTSTLKTKSVHGLICFQKSSVPLIWNPSLRSFLSLSKPEKSWKGIVPLLGYDPIEGRHKVLCLPYLQNCNECRVLTVGSDEKAWRTVRTNLVHYYYCSNTYTGSSMQCINGVLYYLAVDLVPHRFVIMRFDVRSEKLDMIHLIPSWATVMFRVMTMVAYQGKLAFVESDKDRVKMCVLEDAEKGQWSEHSFLPRSHYGQGLNTFKLIDITVEGELIYVPKTVFKSLHILYIDPKRKTLRRVAYSGILDDDFRQRNRLGNRHQRLQFFPNHIETLM